MNKLKLDDMRDHSDRLREKMAVLLVKANARLRIARDVPEADRRPDDPPAEAL